MAFVERRRWPRVTLAPGTELRLSKRVHVRLVDISAGGALVACDERLPVGTKGRLRLALGGEPFEASVEIKREDTRPESRTLLGAAILSAGQASQDALEQFLRRAPE
jgi:c-di-GMP-binding flagellar brake protein YcgR